MKNNLYGLFIIVITNYLIQIPYDYHLYGFNNLNIRGMVLLILSFVLFIVPYVLLLIKKSGGYSGMILFLTIEFLFYLLNFIGSIAHGYTPFYQLKNADPILFTAFLVGYINFIASGYFLFYFLNNRKKMVITS